MILCTAKRYADVVWRLYLQWQNADANMLSRYCQTVRPFSNIYNFPNYKGTKFFLSGQSNGPILCRRERQALTPVYMKIRRETGRAAGTR
jgi:hypothetical protein